MVYIRPSAPVVTTTAVKPAGESSRVSGEHPLAADTLVTEYVVTPETERRRSGQDRRQQRKNALFETRAGKDRRKSQVSISVSI